MMSRIKSLGWSAVLLALVASAIALNNFGEKSPLIASGSVRIEPSLEEQAVGLRTLFITVFDQDSPRPMPFGAMKEKLRSDFRPEESFEFLITRERLQIMNPNAAFPVNLRIKARLDIDGFGGMDQPGDITGEISGVALGSKEVQIILNQKLSPNKGL
jgi:hypothetical protein